MKTLIPIIGMPGSGKSTIMKNWMDRWDWTYHRDGLVDHYVSGDLIVLGRYDEGEVFSGTDRLAMNVMPEAIEFLQKQEDKIVIFEGDRLSSSKFFRAALDSGYDLKILNITVLDNIREKRYQERGSDQSKQFIESRRTKVKNLLDEFGPQMTLFGEELGYVTTLANNFPEDAEEISGHIASIIDDAIIGAVISDL